MRISHLKSGIVVCALLLPLAAGAASDKVVTNGEAIDRILLSIPSNDKAMPYKTLAERLPNLGLTVTRILYGTLGRDEVEASQGLYRKGDVLYDFSMSEPNDVVKRLCPIWRSFSLVKRGNGWLPNDRTANFLLNGYRCMDP